MDVRGKGFKEYIRVEEALKRLEDYNYPLGYEEVNLLEALDRVNYEDIYSNYDLPPLDKAAMDGYALRAEDTFGASPQNPIILRLTDKENISKGEAKYVNTGNPLPKNSNAVLMVEEAKKISEEEIEVYHPVTPWKNVARVGEDLKKGELILKKGIIITPQDIALLASLGLSKLKVVRRLKVGVLSTGNELVDVGSEKGLEEVYDVNRYSLSSLCIKMGCEVLDLGIAKDDLEDIKIRLERGLKEADLVLVSGGSSVGEKDLMVDVINSIKGKVIFHGLALRPGAPTGLFLVKDKLIFSLPGYPVSSMVAFDALVKPCIYKILKAIPPKEKKIKVKMAKRVPSIGGLRSYVRVKLVDSDLAEPIRIFGAGIISSLAKADGIVIVPEDKEGIEEGEEVEVILLR